ncbi:SulP family inorganic anion transporter [Nitratireductor basaltis]|uniref:Sulfate transporter permease n=1 Tax=Nitratireductor basaltis TaxID=472175 RepID=A0A084U8G0_9HYPH|nr:sulfate permease [Nitratireductor basaltis]KFB09246.1 Sulfate transporter permease [Nitratireductor basaltis]
MQRLGQYLPILDWAQSYGRATLTNDMVAAVIVTIMLIPQSLAYAMIAGLPPEVGLYASILPLVAYAIFGTSRTLAVGPVAVVSLMTATAVGNIAAEGSADYLAAAMLLAFLSGAMLLAMGFMRLGFIANFLSHPVISGFITASGLLIAASQLKHVLGVDADGHTLPEILSDIAENIGQTNMPTLIIGVAVVAFLYFTRLRLKSLLLGLGLSSRPADIITKAGPVLAIAATILATEIFKLGEAGVKLVGDIPAGLPVPALPSFDIELVMQLAGPAFLISIIGFVESVSVAQTLASRRRQRIDPDQELIGLGASNIASSLSSGYPVTGGFARSVVNFDAGAETPAAGAYTAIGIALATMFLTPLLAALPRATLAATIIVAVLSLVDLGAVMRVWRYSKADFIAMAATILGTLFLGVEIGIMLGVGLSILLHLYRTSKPHMAVVGQVPGTEHFRNVERHDVRIFPHILSLRVDESLYFANSRYLEDRVAALVAEKPALKHVILQCSAVNEIDASALESLEEINHRLSDAGICLHLSEVKGPVMDRLKRSSLLEDLTGEVFLSQHEAEQNIADRLALKETFTAAK